MDVLEGADWVVFGSIWMYEASYWNLDWTGDLQITYVEVMVEGKEVDVTSEGEKTKQNKIKSQVSTLMNVCIYEKE